MCSGVCECKDVSAQYRAVPDHHGRCSLPFLPFDASGVGHPEVLQQSEIGSVPTGRQHGAGGGQRPRPRRGGAVSGAFATDYKVRRGVRGPRLWRRSR